MRALPSKLNRDNITPTIRGYRHSIEQIGQCIRGADGIQLLRLLKRGKVLAGPYPDVSLFEAANRIMTDMVILHGVKWLLDRPEVRFREYAVDFGHFNAGPHDIVASAGGRRLVGEAFNVSPSFFPIKKTSALRKLRASSEPADYRVVVCNAEAVSPGYAPKPQEGEFYLFVDIDDGQARLVPDQVITPAKAMAS